MDANVNRISERNTCDIPIMYGLPKENEFHQTRMHNFNRRGVYLEPVFKLEPKAEICVIMQDREDSGEQTTYRSMPARVKWCDKVGKNGSSYYGAGIEFKNRGDMFLSSRSEDNQTACRCDLCDEQTRIENLTRLDDWNYTCPACYQHLKETPCGKIKRSIQRFMDGNVL